MTKFVAVKSGPVELSATVREAGAAEALAAMNRIAELQERHRITPPIARNPADSDELFALFDKIAALERAA